MALSKDELMKPRRIVTNIMPILPVKVGQIFNEDFVQFNIWGEDRYVRINLYPHLFKLLEWWEERKIDDMPEYVRLNQVTVCKVAKHFITIYGESGFMDSRTKYDYSYTICQPATKEEYESKSNN